jgi:hypothetical protein
MPDPKPDLAAIEARVEAATEGPWEATPNDRILSLTYPCEDVAGQFGNKDAVVEALRKADAEFIAHARTDVPALVAYARELQAEVELHMAYSDRDAQTAAEMATRAFAAEVALARVMEVVNSVLEWDSRGNEDVVDLQADFRAALAAPTTTDEGDETDG